MKEFNDAVKSLNDKLEAQAASGVAPTPAQVAGVLNIFITLEPAAQAWLVQKFPTSPVVTAAVALAPMLLPALQQLEQVLATAS